MRILRLLIRIKRFLQKIWERDMSWNLELQDDLKRNWIMWCNKIKDLLELRIDVISLKLI